jgi:hypothetical protein
MLGETVLIRPSKFMPIITLERWESRAPSRESCDVLPAHRGVLHPVSILTCIIMKSKPTRGATSLMQNHIHIIQGKTISEPVVALRRIAMHLITCKTVEGFTKHPSYTYMGGTDQPRRHPDLPNSTSSNDSNGTQPEDLFPKRRRQLNSSSRARR